YVLDWTTDDQPYPLNVPGMISVRYSVELGRTQRSAAVRAGDDRAGLRPHRPGPVRPTARRRGTRRPGDGPRAAPVRHRTGVPAQVPSTRCSAIPRPSRTPGSRPATTSPTA